MRRRDLLFLPVAAATVCRAQSGGDAELPLRQIHLDFHTSELVPDVAADFNAAEFAKTLRDARVNSINVFAKCHHGYAYYDARIGVKHPSLKADLLGEMTEACGRAGIAVNYYYSLVWDVYQSRKHPEWLAVDKDGKHMGGPPSDTWPWLCMNSPYMEQVYAENQEIVSKYKLNGAFFDILKQPPDGCFCKWCVEDRRKLGLENDIPRHNKAVAMRVEKRLFDLLKSRNPKALIFYNNRLVIGVRDELPYYSHIEIESLPRSGWGYSHLQQRVRYMRTLGKEMVGVTGRFHKSCGDFGGFENQAALDFECLNFIANGAKVCIGDQLHPRGRLEAATYKRIGAAYRKIEALEPWTRGARAVVDIGVISTAAIHPAMTATKITPVDQGFTNMLIELHQQFDVLDLDADLAAYKVIIVPDEIRPSEKLTRKLLEYLDRGGAMLVSGTSLLDGAKFAIDLGVRYEGPAKFKDEYMVLKPGVFPGLDETPYFLYQHGVSVAAKPGTEVLATYGHPYFDHSPERFVSHKQTPMDRVTSEPLITRKDNVIYIANPFFGSYSQDGYGIQKQVVAELLRLLLAKPAVLAPNLPSTAQVTMLEQRLPTGIRRVVHVLYYPFTRRGPNLDIVEEPGLLENIRLSVRLPQHPLAVVTIPDQKPVEFVHNEFYTTFTLPRILGHQAIAFE